MARAGRVYLPGDGSNRINPIHGADLADVCAEALDSATSRLDVGGPDESTYRGIAELAFDVLDKPKRITCVPRSLVSATVGAMRLLTPAKIHGPIHFLASVMTMDLLGQPHGRRRLADHFRKLANADGTGSKSVHYESRMPIK